MHAALYPIAIKSKLHIIMEPQTIENCVVLLG